MSDRELVCSVCGDDPLNQEEFEAWQNAPDDVTLICDACWVTGGKGQSDTREAQTGPHLFGPDTGAIVNLAAGEALR